MKIHKTSNAGDTRPVMYRHAKCKNCDHEFTYWRGAAENGTRPECPECDEQGISGPFGRINPAEYLPIVLAAAEGTGLEYRHWLAGEAVVRVDYFDRVEQEPEPIWFYVDREPVGDVPCVLLKRVDEDGSVSTPWKPHTYQQQLDNGVEMTLVPTDECPEEDWSCAV